MKTTFKVVLSAALMALTVPAVASAQGGMGGGMGGGNAAERQAQMRARMFEGITLTPEQTAKIDSIQAGTRAKRQEMMQSGNMDRQKMMEMQQEEAKAIKALLTPEQAAIYDKNREAMMQRRGGGVR